jgi:hypothetical protein
MLDAFKRIRENVYVIPLHRQIIPGRCARA